MNPVDITSPESCSQLVSTPAKHKMIPGVPLRLQFMRSAAVAPATNPQWVVQKSEPQAGNAIKDGPQADNVPQPASASLSPLVLPARSKKEPKPVPVGSITEDSTQYARCGFCLLWFTPKQLKKHIRRCEDTANHRLLLCPLCQGQYSANKLCKHLARDHRHLARGLLQSIVTGRQEIPRLIEAHKRAVAAAAKKEQQRARRAFELRRNAANNLVGKPLGHELLPEETKAMIRKYGPGQQCANCLYWFKESDASEHQLFCMEKPRAAREQCTICGLVYLQSSLPMHMQQKHPESLSAVKKTKAKKTKDSGKPKMTASATEENPSEKAPAITERIPCKFCQVPIRKGEMESHLAKSHSKTPEWTPQGAVRKFPFVLLPPSKDGLREVIERYRRLTRAHPHSLMDVHYDWERLEAIEHLDPIARYVGTKVWKGYVVFEFQHSNGVILECPKTGNATYVLEGNWREMISASKRELRSEFRHHCTRIVHCSDWIRRVKNAVFRPPKKEVIIVQGVRNRRKWVNTSGI